VARVVNLSLHRVKAICDRYVDLAVAATDLSGVTAVAIDETSARRGQDYISLVADMDGRRVVFVTPGKDAGVVERFARHLEEHNAVPGQIESVSIDMSAAFIKGVDEHLPDARVTFDKFHVVAHASKALDGARRAQQKTDPSLKGMRWSLLKDAEKLDLAQLTDLEALISQYTTNRTARAWMYREQLREILDRKQIHVVSKMLRRWCGNVMRSKVEPMKDVARMIRRHFDGIVAWAQTRQTNGFIEAINGLFQAAKRKARGYVRFKTRRTVLFLIAANSTSPPSTRMPDDGRHPLRFQKADKKLTVANYMFVFSDVSGCPKMRHASAEDAVGPVGEVLCSFPRVHAASALFRGAEMESVVLSLTT